MRRRVLRARRASAALLWSAAFLVGVGPALSPATAAAPERSVIGAVVPAEAIRIMAAPDGGGIVVPGQDLVLTVRVSNSSDSNLDPALVQVGISSHLSSPEDLGGWLGGNEFPGVIASVQTPPVPGRGSADVRITIPAASLPIASWGAYGLVARIQTASGSVPDSRGAFVYSNGAPPASAAITSVVPLVLPKAAAGLVTATDLDQLLSPAGVLGRALSSASGRPVALAVDPRIIASIRVLGSSAPSSATQWLEALAQVPNETFPLQYADADPGIQRESGIPALLAPLSFDYATGTASSGAPGGGQAANPGTTAVLKWKYSVSGMLWPGSESLDREDFAYFTESGYSLSILDSTQVTSGTSRAPATVARVGDAKVLIANATLSRGLSSALRSEGSVARDAGLSLAAAATASAAEAANGRSVNLLAAVDRHWLDPGAVPAGSALETISSYPWTRPTALSTLASTPSSEEVILRGGQGTADRSATVSNLFGNEIQVETFSSVVSPPSLLTGRVRNDLLATLSLHYEGKDKEWAEAVSANVDRTNSVLDGVDVVEGSTINLLSAAAEIPVTVSNRLRYPVTVVVSVTPSNGRLVTDQSVTVTVESESRATARIPVTAGVANGEVAITPRLLTPRGDVIAVGTPVTVNVSADWEGIGAILLAVLIGGFFAFSVIRLILVRRRKRDEVAS